MTKVLLIDDEQRMLDLLTLYLTPAGYQCTKTTSGREGLEYIENEQYDLVLLDIMMPHIDGWEVCKKVRTFSDIPIIMLTARTAEEDIIKGLNEGADDYMTKPFDEAELLARMEAILRRTSDQNDDLAIVFKQLKWDADAFSVTYRKKPLPLTPKEFDILGLFLKNPERVFTRDQLLHIIWREVKTDNRTIDSHIRNLRDKLKKVGFPINDHLRTIWGIGYKWVNG